ncbi:MAG: MerR family transcriptional regulator [Candidatus Eisenbacteria bacterium]|uniref:MerR family transcriptional regulator n=1 Tax=Eiseniibacteriota bacterium TaxID=2212470 RepID=A0A7Y2H1Q1_UNCEI|nr:MerR family transcriptional regulator [Candidatus Eisenbacteria bacterium]
MQTERTAPEAGSDPTFSVGEVAELTGIAPATLRIWERRYGVPLPVRLPSGHRRYTQEQIQWLRKVSEALSLGHRVKAVLSAAPEDLDAMLRPSARVRERDADVEVLLELTRRYDGARVHDHLNRLAQTLPVIDYLEKKVGPLLFEVGREWADGNLDVRHEHFLTQIVDDNLRILRVSLGAPTTSSPPVLLTTLSSESHSLGIQMAAVVCQLVGVRFRTLGVSTPVAEIVKACDETNARAVCISISMSSAGVETDKRLSDLRHLLPEHVQIVLGGEGTRRIRRSPRGISIYRRFSEFQKFLMNQL